MEDDSTLLRVRLHGNWVRLDELRSSILVVTGVHGDACEKCSSREGGLAFSSLEGTGEAVAICWQAIGMDRLKPGNISLVSVEIVTLVMSPCEQKEPSFRKASRSSEDWRLSSDSLYRG